MVKKRYAISDKTRARCVIRSLDHIKMSDFTPISIELFHFLYQVPKIPCTLYFRVEREMIEFLKPKDTSKELLDHFYKALSNNYHDVSAYVLSKDYPKFEQMLKEVRADKIRKLLEKDPYLDSRTLELFGELSNASQMVVRGGVGPELTHRVTAAAAKLVDGLMNNPVAIGTLSRMVHSDPTLYDHSASVAMISAVIGTQLLAKPFPRSKSELLARSGLYHDVGKTCVPNNILNKPGRFTPEEFEIMKTHTTLGYEELKKAQESGAEIEDLVARVALEHHERFTGKGYPEGRFGRAEDDEEKGIHLFTRIVTIADVYSALLMKRVYKPAYEAGQAIKIMAENAHDDYDPEIFGVFLKHVVDSLNEITLKMDQKSKGRLLIIENGKIRLAS